MKKLILASSLSLCCIGLAFAGSNTVPLGFDTSTNPSTYNHFIGGYINYYDEDGKPQTALMQNGINMCYIGDYVYAKTGTKVTVTCYTNGKSFTVSYTASIANNDPEYSCQYTTPDIAGSDITCKLTASRAY